ncbi:ATP-grasp domain-containing protein [Bacillus pseudomycoides]|uniref:ATP-grasp domain-containing protein n=1 Tax=Bacillus pseudomycoides TaxID=64104 RepID=UPI001643DA2E|nr:ATP-grasp domain-containing protein [Bacillus pseudomycoides]
MKRKHILIISGRDTSVEMLQNLPVDITLIQSKDRVTSVQYQICKRVIITDLSKEEEVKIIAKTIHQLDPFAAAVSFIEFYLELTAEICEELKISGNSKKPVELTRNKVEMRKYLKKFKLPTVMFRECNSKEEAINFYKEINKPMIIKPLDGAGSRAITLCNSIEEINNAWSLYYKDNNKLILEEYIEGEEYSIEAYTNNFEHEILAITKKDTTGAPNFIETGHQQPAIVKNETSHAIKSVVTKFLDAIEHKDGPSHTEIRVKNGIPYIIESHTRYGGGRIWEMLLLTTGIHLPQYTVCKLLELPIQKQPIKYNYASIKFIIGQAGKFKSVSGLEAVKKLPGLHDLKFNVAKGEIINELRSGSDRIGYILLGGENPNEIHLTIEQALKLINIETEVISCQI